MGSAVAIRPEWAVREERLRGILREMGSMVIGFSGGVDSAFLLKSAVESVGPDRVLAATALSATYPARQLEDARRLVDLVGARHRTVASEQMALREFTANAPDRCYHCKSELYQKLVILAREEGYRWVADGSNADDLGDYRPGLRALEELSIRSPLVEAGLSKGAIRALSRRAGLPTWDRPASPCLSSRFPYGEMITDEKLRQVEAAEEALRGLGFRELRVRHHDTMARIEVARGEIPRLLDPAIQQAVVDQLKKVGYTYVALDLGGYRTGSLNEVLGP